MVNPTQMHSTTQADRPQGLDSSAKDASLPYGEFYWANNEVGSEMVD